MLIFDCCHSGGLHRQSAAKARGISPPDDIRHRQLKWDAKTEMWVDREFQRINPKFSTSNKANKDFFGGNGATVRLGRATLLRKDTDAQYRRARNESEGPVGPYLPLIVEACAEEQLSFEYRHGATSYGAFTFCLASILREEMNITFEDLVAATRRRLAELQYDQTPQILGPTASVGAKVPWKTGTKAKSPKKRMPGGSTPRLTG
jgi:metacaspase-1